MFEKSNKTFIELNEEQVEYLIKNVRRFSWWTGRNLNPISRSYDEWNEVYADGGGAIGILKDKDIKDRFIRCRYELDTRDIQLINIKNKGV